MCHHLASVGPPVHSPGNELGGRGNISFVELGLLSFGDRQHRSIGPHKPLEYYIRS